MTTLRVLLASLLVYLVAACASAVERSVVASDSGPSRDAPGETTAEAAPTSDAGTGPVTVTASCTPTDAGLAYAEGAFPGYTATQLAGVHAIAQASGTELASAPPGYTSAVIPFWVRDGAVAASCGSAGAPFYDSVTFVLP